METSNKKKTTNFCSNTTLHGSKKTDKEYIYMGNARKVIRGGEPGEPEWAFRLKRKIRS